MLPSTLSFRCLFVGSRMKICIGCRGSVARVQWLDGSQERVVLFLLRLPMECCVNRKEKYFSLSVSRLPPSPPVTPYAAAVRLSKRERERERAYADASCAIALPLACRVLFDEKRLLKGRHRYRSGGRVREQGRKSGGREAGERGRGRRRSARLMSRCTSQSVVSCLWTCSLASRLPSFDCCCRVTPAPPILQSNLIFSLEIIVIIISLSPFLSPPASLPPSPDERSAAVAGISKGS